MNIIGYARVSDEEQDLVAQKKVLEEYGCKIIYEEKASGFDVDRPVLNRCLQDLRAGDKLVIDRLDRISRNAEFAFKIKTFIIIKRVSLEVLSNPDLDLQTAEGNLIYGFQAVMGQYYRDKLSELVKRGMKTKKAMGIHVGRPAAFVSPEQYENFLQDYRNSMSISSLCENYNLKPSTVHKYIKKAKEIGLCV